MPKVTALSPIFHDGVEYLEGESLDVKPEQAAQLVAAGVAADPTAAKRSREIAKAQAALADAQAAFTSEPNEQNQAAVDAAQAALDKLQG